MAGANLHPRAPPRPRAVMALTFEMGIRVRAPRELVFQHLLLPQHLARWFCNFVTFDAKGPAVGTRFRFGGDYAIAAADPPGWTCEIMAGEVLRSVSFRWPLFGADTRVDWRVEEDGEGSIFRVVHAGVPREDSTCGRFQDAWRVCLGNLKAIAEGRDDSLRPDSSPVAGTGFRLNLLVTAPRERVSNALSDAGTLRAWTEAGDPPVDPRAFSLEEKSGDRTGLSFRREGPPPMDPLEALRLRCRWSDRLVGLKNVVEAGETGFTEPYAGQVTRT